MSIAFTLQLLMLMLVWTSETMIMILRIPSDWFNKLNNIAYWHVLELSERRVKIKKHL
jgi:hypothetical protein